jgi:hypothetical protein
MFKNNYDYLLVNDGVSKKQILKKKNISRCIIINVDPETAVRDTDLEPLRTLRS